MKINRSNILTVSLTLILGLVLGAVFFGGGSSSEQTEHSHEVNANGEWTCSMHPQVRQSEPGSCPFCGMDLIPLEDSTDDEPRVLKMSDNAIELANIQTAIVQRGSESDALSLQGKVKVDEREVNVQTTHFAGRVEKLYKNFEGDLVKVGDKVASIYSPELVAAQEELIEAKKLEKSNPILLEAARKKLHHWKLTKEQISAIESSEAPMRNFDLLADYDGVVTEKMVNTGSHLHEGGGLLEISDLSNVWVVFEVYERDLDKVKIGDKIDFKTRQGETSYTGVVSFISPEVDPQTRIVEVRADVRTDGALKPEMFVEAVLSGTEQDALMVPKSAVLWTGKRSVVYVKSPNEQSFELREVVLGASVGDSYAIESGLSSGEEVVVNGVFTLDAEAQLRGKLSMMNTSSTIKKPESKFIEVELPEVKNYRGMTSSEFQNQLSSFSTEYLVLKDLMVEGNGVDIAKQATKVSISLDKVDMSLLKGEAHMHWMAMLEPMKESLDIIKDSNDSEIQRLQFINLSKALINSLESFGANSESPLYVQYCPMANDNTGARWISQDEEVINPYFGDAMLNCGSLESVIETLKNENN